MKWPWVSASTCDALRDRVEYLKGVIEQERARHDRLFAAYERLRIEKLANPVVYPTEEQIARVEEKYEDLGMEVEMAIADRAQGDAGLERALWQDARRMLARNEDPAEVARRILDGETNDD